jgi:hypothetical protein
MGEWDTQASRTLLLRELPLCYIANNFFNIYCIKLVIFLLESSRIGLSFKEIISLVSLLFFY